jgi:hypothetical protein
MQPNTMQQMVKLFIAGKGLRDMDIMSKSDPYAVLYQGNTIVGRTATVKNSNAPQFPKGFEVPYMFETRQDFKIVIYDDDGNGPGSDDVMATVTFQLAHVMSSRGCSKEFPANPGAVIVTAETAASTGRDTVELAFEGHKLKNMDFMGKSDPYFKLSRLAPNGTASLLYKSEVKDDTLDPRWRPLPPMRVSQLTTADFNAKTILFECFDQDVTEDEPMGKFTCSFQDLMTASQSGNGLMLKDAANKDYGTIKIPRVEIQRKPGFVDFLRGGLQINVAVSVDFTGSNGDPRSSKSLHYMDPVQPNQYMRAIMSVCDILLEYDADKMVPAFGFGAQEPMPSNATTHFFHLNNQPNPYVPGVQGVLNAYAEALQRMRLSGPTNFAPTINSVRQLATSSGGFTYTVLLILTDGEITDMEQTLAAIKACEREPISIVIVGVGSGCDFACMAELDGDGRRATRDVVQFVPFRDYLTAPPAALAAEVLREIPGQVEQWAELTGRNPPPAAIQPSAAKP